MRNGAWIMAALLLVACTSAASSPEAAGDPLLFPTHHATLGLGADAGLDGAMDGTLRFRDGCLLIETDEGARFLAIWPIGTKPGVINSLPVVLTADDVLLLETGDPMIFLGAEIHPDRAGEYLQGRPAACDPERFWLVGDVESGR